MSRVLVVGSEPYRSAIESHLRGSLHQVVSVGDEYGAMNQSPKNIDFFVLGVRFPLGSKTSVPFQSLTGG